MTWEEIEPLILRAQDGDRAAFGELAERYRPAVQSIALARLRDAHEASELTQEVFLHAMNKIGQLREPRCFVGWLRQITVRLAINRLTRRPRPAGTDPIVLQNTADEASGPLDEIVRAEERQAVWQGLDQLKPLDRDTLVAFYIRGHSLKRMSRDFETPVGTIKRRLHVARNRLRERMEGQHMAV